MNDTVGGSLFCLMGIMFFVFRRPFAHTILEFQTRAFKRRYDYRLCLITLSAISVVSILIGVFFIFRLQ